MEPTTINNVADFYFGYEDDDYKAYDLIVESGICCRFLGFPWDAPTPLLVVNGRTFVGLASIESYIRYVTQ